MVPGFNNAGGNYFIDFEVVWVLQFSLGIVASVIIFFSGSLLAGSRVGFFAGLLFAMNGIVLFYEGLLLRESLALFFLILSFFLFLKGKSINPLFLNNPILKVKNTRAFNIYLICIYFTQSAYSLYHFF